MARPRTLPESDSELERLLRKHTMEEIASMYGVTGQAVSKAVRDRKLNTPRRTSYKQYVPWRVRVEHSEDYPRRMLRFYAQAQEGKVLTLKQSQQLAKFVAKLDADDAVVQYDPWHPEGPWFYVPRRPGVDTGYVRNPEVP